MRGLLRRVLWLGPTLILVTLVAFGVLASALPEQAGVPHLPLYLNPDPRGVEELALHAVARVVAGGADAAAQADELARLGGAALPFVLPALDTLTPEGRGRVARALAPVRMRMGFESEGEDQSQEVLFWSRFWEEHSIDFRPIVAEQAVRRVAQRSSAARRGEIRRLDTYALSELIRGMAAPIEREQDVERVAALSELAADVTGREVLRLPARASVDEARTVAAAWQDFWNARRVEYTTYRGAERVVAMFRDTRYGNWVAQAVRRDLGVLQSGQSAWRALTSGARISVPLLLAGLVGSWLSGVVWAAVAAGAGREAGRVLRLVAGLSSALPAVVLAALLAPPEGPAPLALGVVVMLCAGLPLVSLYPGLGQSAGLGRRFVRSLRALGASRWQAALGTVKLSSPALLVQLGTQTPSVITLAFVVEYALGLPGLGTLTIQSVKAADLNWLMAITLASTLVVGLLQIVSELAVSQLDPRLGDGAPRAGAFE
jgi:ABC-type dipeptide/oligopeptide/nickel transport system permease component